MDSRPHLQIAGHLTVADWKARHAVLLANPAPDIWRTAFDDFIGSRLELRYLKPIAQLQSGSGYSGVGFSVVTIQCTLLEFLAAASRGLTYRNGGALNAFEYSGSKALFTNFLSTEAPFNAQFDLALAEDFYANVRCGLLHEARTKGGWTILADDVGGRMIDPVGKVVFRNSLQRAIGTYTEAFRNKVSTDIPSRDAFVRKMEGLCQE